MFEDLGQKRIQREILILGALALGDKSGRMLHKQVNAETGRMSLASFYQLMSRLEDSKAVEGWNKNKTIAGQTVKERWYTLLDGGKRRRSDLARKASTRRDADSAPEGLPDFGRVRLPKRPKEMAT